MSRQVSKGPHRLHQQVVGGLGQLHSVMAIVATLLTSSPASVMVVETENAVGKEARLFVALITAVVCQSTLNFMRKKLTHINDRFDQICNGPPLETMITMIIVPRVPSLFARLTQRQMKNAPV